jgi:chromosome segregation ATPase
MGIKGSLNLIEEISMAYIDVDKDIRYYTDPLEERLEEKINTLKERIDDMQEDIGSIEEAVHIIRTSLDTIEEMLKRISSTPTMKQELDNMDYHRQQQGDSYADK